MYTWCCVVLYWLDKLGLITEGNIYRFCAASSLPIWGNTDVVLADINIKDHFVETLSKVVHNKIALKNESGKKMANGKREANKTTNFCKVGERKMRGSWQIM